jgi:hypothetical protein
MTEIPLPEALPPIKGRGSAAAAREAALQQVRNEAREIVDRAGLTRSATTGSLHQGSHLRLPPLHSRNRAHTM